MKKVFRILLLSSFLVAAATASSVLADTYTFQPPDPDLMDLDHNYADLWGIDFSLDANETITGASLFFNDIRNWQVEPNDLFVSLLYDAPVGYSRYDDRASTAVNYWLSDPFFAVELNHYQNLPAVAQDLTYDFSPYELGLLTIAVGNGNLGLGFDADCHFYNHGISFTIETTRSEVPEPATMLLMGAGLAGIAGWRRLRRKDN